jgi:branched-subunit amino acid permease
MPNKMNAITLYMSQNLKKKRIEYTFFIILFKYLYQVGLFYAVPRASPYLLQVLWYDLLNRAVKNSAFIYLFCFVLGARVQKKLIC